MLECRDCGFKAVKYQPYIDHRLEGCEVVSDIKIEDLRIGQEVWVDGDKCVIRVLNGFTDVVLFDGCVRAISDISLTPPRETKRFWIWSFKTDFWFKNYDYLDESGRLTDGVKSENWNETEKIKHENEFIDLECDW